MYSLDQVIYFLEQRQQTEDWNIRDAAIAYLKGYQEVLPEYVALKQYWAEQQVNPPLTWDELTGMKGEPVWVESHRFGNHWYLNRGIKDESCFYFVGHYGENVLLYSDDIGKLWQAYRKKR